MSKWTALVNLSSIFDDKRTPDFLRFHDEYKMWCRKRLLLLSTCRMWGYLIKMKYNIAIIVFVAICTCNDVRGVPITSHSREDSPVDVPSLPSYDIAGRQPNFVGMSGHKGRQPIDETSQNNGSKERQLRGVEVHCQSDECAELIKYINARDPHTVIMFPGRWGK
ncbi:hypothetical protein KP79_PYT04480 [Mizuhopecten yessoensis]|uniref:Uncharacterized protein n=1 Tax=Mizuhopecten yessoensis TaxID=6573 RepID=A0A210PVT9_MIZYE|nr:hypothetical protein KP79_PYT04480 [Mizuhopecten yessoensis]